LEKLFLPLSFQRKAEMKIRSCPLGTTIPVTKPENSSRGFLTDRQEAVIVRVPGEYPYQVGIYHPVPVVND